MKSFYEICFMDLPSAHRFLNNKINKKKIIRTKDKRDPKNELAVKDKA